MRRLRTQISRERLDEIVPLLRRGDKSFEEEIIEGHMRLGISITKRIARKYHYLDIEELELEVEYVIVKTVRQCTWGALNDNNITGFIIEAIKRRISDFISDDRLYGIPSRTVRHWNKTQNEKVRRLPFKIATVKEDYFQSYKEDDSAELIKLKSQGIGFTVPESPDETTEVDIRELIDKLPSNDIEKKILKLREQGYTYIEISQLVGYSKTQIGHMLVSMEEKLNFYFKEAK